MTFAWVGYGWCAVAGSCSALATLMIKLSSNQPPGWGTVKLCWLAGALAVYGLGFVAYGQALSKLQMTLAYPVMTALTVLLVAIAGVTLLGESLGPSKLAGMVLLCIACALLSR